VEIRPMSKSTRHNSPISHTSALGLKPWTAPYKSRSEPERVVNEMTEAEMQQLLERKPSTVSALKALLITVQNPSDEDRDKTYVSFVEAYCRPNLSVGKLATIRVILEMVDENSYSGLSHSCLDEVISDHAVMVRNQDPETDDLDCSARGLSTSTGIKRSKPSKKKV
jgi:hypothetical protein